MDIVVRDVTMDDLEALAPLWDEAQRAAGRRRAVPLALSIDRLRRRVELASGGGFRFLVAWRGDRPTGLATVSLTDGGALMDSPGVHVHVLHVEAAQRRRGIGAALLAAVAGWAQRDRVRPDSRRRAACLARGHALVRPARLRPLRQPAGGLHRRPAPPPGQSSSTRVAGGAGFGPGGCAAPRARYNVLIRHVSRPVAMRLPSSSTTGMTKLMSVRPTATASLWACT